MRPHDVPMTLDEDQSKLSDLTGGWHLEFPTTAAQRINIPGVEIKGRRANEALRKYILDVARRAYGEGRKHKAGEIRHVLHSP